MNADAFIMKGKSVIAMSQGDVTGGLYGLYPLLDISIFKDTYISVDSCHSSSCDENWFIHFI
jgi:hypothetical protein